VSSLFRFVVVPPTLTRPPRSILYCRDRRGCVDADTVSDVGATPPHFPLSNSMLPSLTPVYPLQLHQCPITTFDLSLSKSHLFTLSFRPSLPFLPTSLYSSKSSPFMTRWSQAGGMALSSLFAEIVRFRLQ